MDSQYQPDQQSFPNQGPPTLNPAYYDAVSNPHPAITNHNLHISGLATPDDSPIDKFTRKALLVMNINIGDGKRHSLPVMEDDDPYDLARRFCSQYGLNDNVIDALAQNIYDNMEQVLQESVSVIHQSYRHSPTPHLHEIQDSPFAKQKREFIEPDHKEEQLKRFHGAEEDEPLEQIEKQFSDEPEDNSQKPSQYTSVDPHEYNKSPMISHQQFAQRRSSINALEQNQYKHPEAANNTAFGSILTDDIRGSDRTTATNPENLSKRDGVWEEADGRRSYNKNWDNEIKLSLMSSDPRPVTQLGYAEYNKKTPPRPNKHRKAGDQETPTHMKHYMRSSLQSTPKKDSASVKKSPNKKNLVLNKSTVASPARSGHSPRKSPQSFFGIPENVPYEQVSLQRDVSRSRNKGTENTTRNRSVNPANDRSGLSPSRANISSASIYSNSRKGDSMMMDKKDEIVRTKSASRVRAEIDGCTFEPKINKLSERIATEKNQNRTSGGKVYDKLYNLHKAKEAYKEAISRHLDDECTFTPSINSHQSPVTRMSFEERNKKFVQRSKKIEEYNKHKERYDPKTGKPLFQPQTGRAPAGERNQQRLPIGEYLYNKPTQSTAISQAIIQNTKEATVKNNIETSPLKTSNPAVDKNQAILDNTAKTKFERIFYDLDSDHDGYISAANIDINPIEPDVLQVIAPLLCAMEEAEQVLSLDEFVDQALLHLKGLDSFQRNRFIYGAKFNSYEEPAENYTFKPEINKKSVELAKNKRPTGGDLVTMYDKQMREKLAREQRLKMEQERRQMQELENCSFRPTVNKKSEKMVEKMGMTKKWTVTPVDYRFD